MTSTGTPSTEDVVKAAMSVARDAAEARLDPAALEAAVVAELTTLIDCDHDPGSPLSDLQAAVARRVLARGDLAADELAEWLSVARSRAEAASAAPTPGDG